MRYENKAVYWVSIGHYEAVGNWWYWVSRGHLFLYILHKVEIWKGVMHAWLTHSLTLKDSATQLLVKYKSGALVTQFEEYQESTKTLPTFRRRRLTWRLTRWDVWEGPRWRSVDRCEKQPFVQVQLIKAEDGKQINSKLKLIAQKQTNFLLRCSYTYKNIIRDGKSTALYAIRCWHCLHCSEQKVWM